jgi:hypothetical protein
MLTLHITPRPPWVCQNLSEPGAEVDPVDPIGELTCSSS